MVRFCEECGKEINTKVISKNEIYRINDEKVEVEAKVLVCAKCGEEFFCEELDQETLVAAYNIYRRKHKLLLPEEIKQIREQYGLSQRSLAKLLNWGDKTIHRYENGSLQDRAHNSMLVFLQEPSNMKKYVLENEVGFDEKKKEKLLLTIEQMEVDSGQRAKRRLLDIVFFQKPSIENGFKSFDYDKFCAMVLYLAQKGGELLKVKLLKLLNYSDMIFYKENGISISGSSYIHLPYGPVPKDYDMLFGMMASDQIAHIEVLFENGYEKHQVIPDQDVPEGILSDAEAEVLDRVYERFKEFGSGEISKYSHNEKGYSSTRLGEVISYQFAKEIELFAE